MFDFLCHIIGELVVCQVYNILRWSGKLPLPFDIWESKNNKTWCHEMWFSRCNNTIKYVCGQGSALDLIRSAPPVAGL